MPNDMLELKKVLTMVTPLGEAEAHFVIDGGRDGLEWVCFQRDTGECWIWPNRQIRLHPSLTEYRYQNSAIHETPQLTRKLKEHRARAAVTAAVTTSAEKPSLPSDAAPQEVRLDGYLQADGVSSLRQPNLSTTSGEMTPTVVRNSRGMRLDE